MTEKPEKVSLNLPNVANNILEWLNSRWPTLPRGFQHSWTWATGSNVWSLLYDMTPLETSDLDLFVCQNSYVGPSPLQSIYKAAYTGPLDRELAEIEKWAAELPQAKMEIVPTRKMTTSLGGKRYYTEGGNLDIWKSSHSLVVHQLLSYPEESHAHCRAAINLHTTELIVLPNTKATRDGAFEDAERRAIALTERMMKLRA